MKFRHEWKHQINYTDLLSLRQNLKVITSPDPNSINGTYDITSLYFDNMQDKALLDKLNGVAKREKFRIRYYNHDTNFIKLEKKLKINSLCNKESLRITKEEVEKILNGNVLWMKNSPHQLLQELYYKISTCGLKPKTIISYKREPFIYTPGNVRITLDYNIKTSIRNTDFLNNNASLVPVQNSPIVLEVKWDEYLPTIIKDAVALSGRRASAISKYALGRIYG